jgi:tetratricopeptide (TPR) repeat protein
MMRQAFTPACLIFIFGRRFSQASSPHHRRMPRNKIAALLLSLLVTLCAAPLFAQVRKTAPSANTTTAALTPERAITLGEQGHCKEVVSELRRVMTGQSAADAKRKAGILGLRCSLSLENNDSTLDFIRLLSKQFPQDPEVLYVLVHAFSDLSTRTAQNLGRTAPTSIPAHKLNAEAMEMQGKWPEAEHEYENMIAKEPNSPGLHFLLGRLLLSKPDATPEEIERSKQEFQKEIEIDPKNAGAHYVLGELARRTENWDEAIAQFSEAAKIDPNFAEAFFGWGFCLVNAQRYQEAIAPLRVAERLTPDNPSVHYSLATALVRTGQKEEAQKEFEIHRNLTATKPAPAANSPQ